MKCPKKLVVFVRLKERDGKLMFILSNSQCAIACTVPGFHEAPTQQSKQNCSIISVQTSRCLVQILRKAATSYEILLQYIDHSLS